MSKHNAYRSVMQLAYSSPMEENESPRRARRRQNLEILVEAAGGAAQVSRESGTPRSHLSAMLHKKRGLGDELAEKLELIYSKPAGWFDSPQEVAALANPKANIDELVIPQYKTGGSMGGGLVLRDQPGMIASWRVTNEWIQKNVHNFTAARNLAIVTGFGDSMRPLYNPGDPLLVDTGVKLVDFDGIYFFRIGNEGFIKRLQRVPGEGLVALSENKSYRDWVIKDDMDCQIFARVIKVWRGEDF